MPHSYFTCPHCNGQVKVIAQRYKQQTKSFSSELSSMATSAPSGVLSSFFYFMFGHRTTPGIEVAPTAPVIENKITVEIREITPDKKHWIMSEFDKKIIIDTFNAAHYVVIDKGLKWTRKNFTKAGVSQGQFHLLSDDMKRLGYLELERNNLHSPTPRGLRVMKYIGYAIKQQQATTQDRS